MAPADLGQAVRVLARLTRYVEKACQESELSLPQYRLLLFIANESQRAGELATRAAVSRPTLTSLIDGLERQGLVERARVTGDRRGISLVLTDKGREALTATEVTLRERVGPLLSSIDGAIEALNAVGVALDENLATIFAKQAEEASA